MSPYKQSNKVSSYFKDPFANIKFQEEDQLSDDSPQVKVTTLAISPDFKNVQIRPFMKSQGRERRNRMVDTSKSIEFRRNHDRLFTPAASSTFKNLFNSAGDKVINQELSTMEQEIISGS